jgi:formyl-CoA transferase
MPGALEGIRVLDLSRILAGPMCAMTLADLGADVVKVERPGSGDDVRQWGPPYAGTESAYYLALNRNKRSITINLSAEAGRNIVRQLAAQSDVVVENFKTGALDGMGLGYCDLSAGNPGLIYSSITGYGHTGPDKGKAGYDFAIQGRGGIMSITGEPDGQPMKVGLAIIDVLAALNACVGILASLHVRSQTGRGQHIDIALLDSECACLTNQASNYLVGGMNPGRVGNSNPNIVPYQAVKASDAWFNIAVGNNQQFARLCAALGAPELAADSRFAGNPDRVRNRQELVPLMAERFQQRTVTEWLDILRKENVPADPINSIPQVFSDEQVLAREMVVDMPHPTVGSVKLVGSPLKLSNNPVSYVRHPPLLGEHTDEILGELGYSDEEITHLREEGAI